MEGGKTASSEEVKETRPTGKAQNQCEDNDGRGVEEFVTEATNEEPHEGVSAFSSLVSSPVTRPYRDIDSIVGKHLEDFSSDIQQLLQREGVHYNLPQTQHTSLNAETSTPQSSLPYMPMSQCSQYVSFYNPCPPVQDYLSSLQTSISCMLSEYDDRWSDVQADRSQTPTDASLANRISDFVASVRAANSVTGRDDEDRALLQEHTAGVIQGSELSRGDEVWKPDAAKWRRSPTLHVTLANSTSACASGYKPANSLEISRTVGQTQDNAIRTAACTADVEGEGGSAGLNCTVTVPGFSDVTKQLADASCPSMSSESVPEAARGATPSAKDLNSVINQLEPDVLNNLVEIMKDIKKKSPHFYIHCTDPGDQVYEEVKVTSNATSSE